MTALPLTVNREQRLRERIDQLVDDRHRALTRANRLARRLDAVLDKPARCVYCGEPTSRGLTCAGHRDLPRLDPHYRGLR